MDYRKLAEMEETARRVGYLLRDVIADAHGDKNVGFCLVLFSFGAGEEMTYLSNAQRPDMIQALEEMILNLKTGQNKIDPTRRN